MTARPERATEGLLSTERTASTTFRSYFSSHFSRSLGWGGSDDRQSLSRAVPPTVRRGRARTADRRDQPPRAQRGRLLAPPERPPGRELAAPREGGRHRPRRHEQHRGPRAGRRPGHRRPRRRGQGRGAGRGRHHRHRPADRRRVLGHHQAVGGGQAGDRSDRRRDPRPRGPVRRAELRQHDHGVQLQQDVGCDAGVVPGQPRRRRRRGRDRHRHLPDERPERPGRLRARPLG